MTTEACSHLTSLVWVCVLWLPWKLNGAICAMFFAFMDVFSYITQVLSSLWCYLPSTSLGCLCPQTFFLNNGLNMVPWNSFIPDFFGIMHTNFLLISCICWCIFIHHASFVFPVVLFTMEWLMCGIVLSHLSTSLGCFCLQTFIFWTTDWTYFHGTPLYQICLALCRVNSCLFLAYIHVFLHTTHMLLIIFSQIIYFYIKYFVVLYCIYIAQK